MKEMPESHQGPHQGQPVLSASQPLEKAKAAMLMVHGRGARAEDILALSTHLTQPGFAFLAPQAAGNIWYPNRFLAPLESNEPWLSSALAFLTSVCSQIFDAGMFSDIRCRDSPQAHLSARLLTRRLPDARIRCPQRPLLWRHRRTQWGIDRSGKHAARLSWLVGWNTRIFGLQ